MYRYDWEAHGFSYYWEVINARLDRGYDRQNADEVVSNCFAPFPKLTDTDGIEVYLTFCTFWGHALRLGEGWDWSWAHKFQFSVQGKTYEVRVAHDNESPIGTRHLLGLVYVLTGQRLYSTREIQEILEYHYKDSAHRIYTLMPNELGIPPNLDGGNHNAKYYSLREIVRLLPSRPRCEVCHKKIVLKAYTRRCDRSKMAKRLLTVRRLRKEKKDKKQWNKGKKTLKQIRQLLLEGESRAPSL